MSRWPAGPRHLLAAVVLLAGGCSGTDGGAAPGGASASPSGSSPASPTAESAAPSVRPGPTEALRSTDGFRTSVVARLEVGGNPCGVVVAHGFAWVTDATEARLLRISLDTNRVVGTTRVDDAPCELTSAYGSLWVTTQSDRLDRVDPDTGRVVDRIRTGSTSYETIAAFGSLWVSNRGDGTITQVDPGTGESRSRRVGSVQPGGMVAADGYLWLGQDSADATTLLRIDPDTWEITEVETGGNRPAWLAVTPGVVWVAHNSSATTVGIDTGSLELIGLPAASGFSPVNLEASPDGHWVWVPDDWDSFVTRIDARSGDAVERLEVGGGPAVVAAGNREVWVTNFEEGSVWRLRLGRR